VDSKLLHTISVTLEVDEPRKSLATQQIIMMYVI
jgi:hypothetical protein